MGWSHNSPRKTRQGMYTDKNFHRWYTRHHSRMGRKYTGWFRSWLPNTQPDIGSCSLSLSALWCRRFGRKLHRRGRTHSLFRNSLKFVMLNDWSIFICNFSLQFAPSFDFTCCANTLEIFIVNDLTGAKLSALVVQSARVTLSQIANGNFASFSRVAYSWLTVANKRRTRNFTDAAILTWICGTRGNLTVRPRVPCWAGTLTQGSKWLKKLKINKGRSSTNKLIFWGFWTLDW